MTERIERELWLPAPPDEVWDAITATAGWPTASGWTCGPAATPNSTPTAAPAADGSRTSRRRSGSRSGGRSTTSPRAGSS